MVDNITLKCYDKEVYYHLRYGTFVEKSNWINGRWYDKLVLNNGKSGDDAHDGELRMRHQAQDAYDLPLPVRPHEGVPPLSAPGREAPFGMICCAASLSFQREMSQEF